MDWRVGKIVDVWKNPESEKLYNEKVDIGGGEIRDIASGVLKTIPIEKMKDAMCIVLVNLRPRPLAGYKSHGMVMMAETEDGNTVELLVPPPGSEIGDKVFFDGYPREPPEQLPKKNPYDNVKPQLFTDGNL